MQSIRYFIRLLLAFFKKFKIIIFIAFFVSILFSLIFFIIKPSFLFLGSDIIGIVGRYSFEDLPDSILSYIGNGLTKVDDKGNILGDLASSWEIKEEGKVWTFKLADNRYWQDGKKVDSDSINFSFSDVEVTKPDDKTIEFKLNTSFSPFGQVVSKPVFKKGLLGTGDWKVIRATRIGNNVQKLVLKNKSGEKKIFKFFPTEEKAKTAFMLGQVDSLEKIISPSPFDEWKTAKISNIKDYESIVCIFFNLEDKYLSEKDIRQMLSYAINKDILGSQRAISPISLNSWAYNSQVKPYSYNPERAKEIFNNLPNELKNIDITLTTSPALLSVAEKIVSDWKNIGISSKTSVSYLLPSEYQAYLAILQIPDDPDQYSIWHSTQNASNISKYRSPRIDKLLEDGRQTLNIENRKKIYFDFQRYLVEDSPAVFLYYPDFYNVERK